MTEPPEAYLNDLSDMVHAVDVHDDAFAKAVSLRPTRCHKFRALGSNIQAGEAAAKFCQVHPRCATRTSGVAEIPPQRC